MKLDDYVKKSIASYPSLYLDADWETSRLQVLNQIFLVLGNGMEWADTGDPATGGYMVDPYIIRDEDGDLVRQKDKPYGEEVYDGFDIQRLFQEPYIEVRKLKEPENKRFPEFAKDLVFRTNFSQEPVYEGFASEIPEDILKRSITMAYEWESEKNAFVLRSDDRIYRKGDNIFPADVLDTVNPIYYIEVQNFRSYIDRVAPKWGRFQPYPFSTRYWAYAEIDPKLIQPDWRQGMIDVMEAALEYYKNTPFGSEGVRSSWRAADFVSVLNRYAQKGTTVAGMLKEYEMTLKQVPELRRVKFIGGEVKIPKGTNIEEFGNAFAKAKYEKERAEQIGHLEDALKVLKPLNEV